MIAVNDNLCSFLVEQKQILESLHAIITEGGCDHKKESLWIIATIAANSEKEAIAVVNSGLLPCLIY